MRERREDARLALQPRAGHVVDGEVSGAQVKDAARRFARDGDARRCRRARVPAPIAEGHHPRDEGERRDRQPPGQQALHVQLRRHVVTFPHRGEPLWASARGACASRPLRSPPPGRTRGGASPWRYRTRSARSARRASRGSGADPARATTTDTCLCGSSRPTARATSAESALKVVVSGPARMKSSPAASARVALSQRPSTTSSTWAWWSTLSPEPTMRYV